MKELDISFVKCLRDIAKGGISYSTMVVTFEVIGGNGACIAHGSVPYWHAMRSRRAMVGEFAQQIGGRVNESKSVRSQSDPNR